jgi:SNF2 family DNA or RNA helicase
MPVFLKVSDDDELAVSLAKLSRAEFDDALARVRSVPGKRWHPEDKTWRFPLDPDVAVRLVQSLAPVPDADVEALVRGHQAEVAGSLTTKLPDDAKLTIPWADELYGFQRAAVDWMVENPKLILADDMGLGKTVETISTVYEHAVRYPQKTKPGPKLVVCPNALTQNWKNEVLKWNKSLDPDQVQIIDGRNAAQRQAQVKRIGQPRQASWAIVNWEKLRIMPELSEFSWSAVIADEAHRGKNRKAKQTKALYKLKAPIQIAATGTPIMNNPAELWSLLNWLYPEVYGTRVKGGGYWPFYYRFVEDYATQYGRVIVGVRNPDALRFELKDKLVRRTKEEVLDLPAKTVQPIEVPLNVKQRKLYEEAEKQLVLDVAAHLAEIHKGKDESEIADEVLELMKNPERLAKTIPNGAARTTRLRQITSSPALLGAPDDSAKLDAAVEIIRDNPGKPFVVFTWFKDTVDLLAKRLLKGKPKLSVGTIKGNDDPQPVVDAFQDGELDIMISTIAKGGVGLTLTRADTAIFVERDWVPAINEQAEDRLHRIGQDSHVTIIVLEASDTVDQSKVSRANKLKGSIVKSVLGGT